MIGKITKGGSFKGCVNYVLGKERAQLLFVSGVLLGSAQNIIRSFEMQCRMKPEASKPVGHISLSYSPEDAPRLSGPALTGLAREYLEEMGIGNTQYIIVRHNDARHPHCHIVYNRIGNDGKLISDRNDFYRNGQVTKKLKEKYGLTFGKDKLHVNRSRLNEPDRTKYEIFRAVSFALSKSKSWEGFIKAVYKEGVRVQPKFKGNSKEIQGISFAMNGYTFKGSEIDRGFSFGNLDKQIKRNADKAATRIVPVSYSDPDGLTRHTRYEHQYTPPPVEDIAFVFSALLDGLFESYYSELPDDSLLREQQRMCLRKKKKMKRKL